MNFINKFFWWCSGAVLPLLEKSETDHQRYFGMGGTVLFTGIMAAFSGSFAIFMTIQNFYGALIFGGLWGLMIFNLDRFIVSIHLRGNFMEKLAKVWPRAVLAVFIGVVIAMPLELRIFEGEIKTQIAENIESKREEARRNLDSSARYDTKKQQKEIEKIEADIDKARVRLKEKEKERDQAYKEYIAEAEGTGGSGIKGKGPLFREKLGNYNKLDNEFKQESGRFFNTQKKWEDEIDDLKKEIKTIDLDKSANSNKYDDELQNYNGLLARLEAFGQLTSSSLTLFFGSWVIRLFIIFIELAPVLMKLLMEKGEYEDKLERVLYEKSIAEKQKISNINDKINTDLKIHATKHQIRLEAEIKANESLLNSVARAQAEIASTAVEEWKIKEIGKIKNSQNNVINHETIATEPIMNSNES
jgi:hypothetical protein